jgi:hypothetical protein
MGMPSPFSDDGQIICGASMGCQLHPSFVIEAFDPVVKAFPDLVAAEF